MIRRRSFITPLPRDDEDERHGTTEEESKEEEEDGCSEDSPSVSSWTEMNVRDQRIGLLSNMFFLTGGVFQCLVAGMDVQWLHDSYADWDTYTICAIAAAVGFLCNALTDLSRAAYTLYRKRGPRRRDAHRDLYSACAFGFGASLDLTMSLIATIADDSSTTIPNAMNIVSAHSYLLSAVLALAGLDVSFSTPSDCLIATGDAMFFVGSIIDVVQSFLDDPDLINEHSTTLARWEVASALLWLFNSIFYLLSDVLTLEWNEFQSERRMLPFGSFQGQRSLQVPLLLDEEFFDPEQHTHAHMSGGP